MIYQMKEQTAALALGGGGARGIAHLGVIEALQETNIHIAHYVGVSIGGLAGALCAVDSDTQRVQKRVVDYLESEEFQSRQASLFSTAPPADEPASSGLFAWYDQIMKYIGTRRTLAALFRKPSLLGADILKDIVDALLPDIDIRDTSTPLCIVALDLYSGRRVHLTEGSLKDAVMASAAIPGVFPPIPVKDMLLCDIGMMDSVPSATAADYGDDLTIAVDVSAPVETIDRCETAADIFMRLYDIGEPLLREYTKDIADLVIRPNVASTDWYDFSDPASLIQPGRDAVRDYRVVPAPDSESTYRRDSTAI